MALVDDMTPHLKAALLEIPIAFRDEVSDVLVKDFDFELWRVAQEPVVDDTPGNRADYISLVFARRVVSIIKQHVRIARAEAADTVDIDLGG